MEQKDFDSGYEQAWDEAMEIVSEAVDLEAAFERLRALKKRRDEPGAWRRA